MSYPPTLSNGISNTVPYARNACSVAYPYWSFSQPPSGHSIQNPVLSQHQMNYYPSQFNKMSYYSMQPTQMNSKPTENSHLTAQRNYPIENNPKSFSNQASSDIVPQNSGRNISGSFTAPQPQVGGHQQTSHQFNQPYIQNCQQYGQIPIQSQQKHEQQSVQPQMWQPSSQLEMQPNLQQHPQQQNYIQARNQQFPYQQQQLLHQQQHSQKPVSQQFLQNQDASCTNQAGSSGTNQQQSTYHHQHSMYAPSQVTQNSWERFENTLKSDRNNHPSHQIGNQQENMNQMGNSQTYKVQQQKYPGVYGVAQNSQSPQLNRQISNSTGGMVVQAHYTDSFDNSNDNNPQLGRNLDSPAERDASPSKIHYAQSHQVEQNYKPLSIGRMNEMTKDVYFNPGKQYATQYANGINALATRLQPNEQSQFQNHPQSPAHTHTIHGQLINQPQPHFYSQPQAHSQPQFQSQPRMQNLPQAQNQPHNQQSAQFQPQNQSQNPERTQGHIRPQMAPNQAIISSITMSNQSSKPFYQTSNSMAPNSQQRLQASQPPNLLANSFESGSRPSNAVVNGAAGISTSGNQGIPFSTSGTYSAQHLNSTALKGMGGYMSYPSAPETETSKRASHPSARPQNIIHYSSPNIQRTPFEPQFVSQTVGYPQSQTRLFAPVSQMQKQQDLVSQMRVLGVENQRGPEQMNRMVGNPIDARDEVRYGNGPALANPANMGISGGDRRNQVLPQSQVESQNTIDPQRVFQLRNQPPVYSRRSSIGDQPGIITSSQNQGFQAKSMQPTSPQNAYVQPFNSPIVTSSHSMASGGRPIVIMPGYASSSFSAHGPKQTNFEARTESILQQISDKQGPMYDKLKKILADIFVIQDDISSFKGRRGDKNYIFIEEMLTRQLLVLDSIHADGNEELRLSRRSIVKQVQGLLSTLEMKAKT